MSSFKMSDLEEQQRLMRPEDEHSEAGFDRCPKSPSRRQQLQAYFWPIAFAISWILFFVANFRGSISTGYLIAGKSSVSSSPVNYVYPENVVGLSQDAILRPDRTCHSSPNAQYRFCILDDGDLLLQYDESKTSAFKPVWWANRGYHKRSDEKLWSWERYVTLDSAGVLRVQSIGSTDSSKSKGTVHQQQWSSDGLQICKTTNKTQLSPVTSQALALDDNGRLVIVSAAGRVTCVLHPGQDMASYVPTLHQTTDLKVVEEPAIPMSTPEGPVWPDFRHSSLLSLLQLRALLEKDVAHRNKTLRLDATQLETIYNTAITIPSWHGHLKFLIKFLRSMVRHCVDCHLFQINVVVNSEDVELFNDAIFRGSDETRLLPYYLPGLRLVEFEKLDFKHYGPEVNVPLEVANLSKAMIQNFKKAYGCFASGKKTCSLLDSEGMFLRTTWYSDVIKEFQDAPFVLHNSDSRHETDLSEPIKDVLDIPNFRKVGWLLEYYQWIFDSNVYDGLMTTIAQKHPSLSDLSPWIFFEIAYWANIWADKSRVPVPGPKHKFIDAKEFFGERFYNLTWHRYVDEDINRKEEVALIECLRTWLDRFPNMLAPAAEAWEKHQLRYYNCHGEDTLQNAAFLGIARSVRMCVSQHEEGTYEMAMAGDFNY